MNRFAWYQLMGTAGAIAVALVALASAVGGPAWAAGAMGSAIAAAPNVTYATEVFYVSNNSVKNGIAECPSGTRVFSGAWATTGQHARVIANGPSRKLNGYLVYSYMPPANLRAGITKEAAKITVIAWCAPVGQPIVLGNT